MTLSEQSLLLSYSRAAENSRILLSFPDLIKCILLLKLLVWNKSVIRVAEGFHLTSLHNKIDFSPGERSLQSLRSFSFHGTGVTRNFDGSSLIRSIVISL